MTKQNYNIIGVMSGTSLDGVDLARINFEIKDNNWNFQLLECETISYSENWILQRKVKYADVIVTPDVPAKAEKRRG